jgi:hypothetical protein
LGVRSSGMSLVEVTKRISTPWTAGRGRSHNETHVVYFADRHPELWERAVATEQKVMKEAGADGDASFGRYGMKGRQYAWSGGESLPALIARRDEILERHQQAVDRTASRKKARTASEVFAEALDEDDDTQQCTVCAL